MEPHALLVLSLFLLTFPLVVRAALVEYNFTLTHGFWSADCVNKQVILINGAYPGPTIYATEGDTLRVNVENLLTTEVATIHWHGIRQYKTCHMDGAAYVSQCPIPNLEVFTYEFEVSKAGTYMYHGHHGLLAASGLYGKIIIREKPGKYPYKYGGEFSLISNDWYHRSSIEIAAGLQQIPIILNGDPQSVVINGRGKYNCSAIPIQTATVPGGSVSGDVLHCDANNTQCAREVFRVSPGKRYRFRLLNIATYSSRNIIFEGHSLKVVGADQYLVKPFTVDNLDINTGQNVDVLVQVTQKPGNYWISAAVRGLVADALTPNGLAILNVGGVPVADPTTPPPVHPAWTAVPNDREYSQVTAYKALDASKGGDTPTVPKTSSRELILVNALSIINGYAAWSASNYTLKLPSTPYLHALKSGRRGLFDPSTPPDKPETVWDYTSPLPNPSCKASSHLYRFKLNSVVDIVLQNANMLAPNMSDHHPWHMHGHHFWVLAYGNGTYTKANRSKFNLVDPPYRNTVSLLPYGWVAIRFLADNPGVWLLHCHISPHLITGMAIAFAVGEPKDMPNLPSNTRKCGKLF